MLVKWNKHNVQLSYENAICDGKIHLEIGKLEDTSEIDKRDQSIFPYVKSY